MYRSTIMHLSEAGIERQVDDEVDRRVGDDEQVSQLAVVELDTPTVSLAVRKHGPQELRH